MAIFDTRHTGPLTIRDGVLESIGPRELEKEGTDDDA